MRTAPATSPAPRPRPSCSATCGPLTGGAAIYGQAVVNGAELAVEEINASDSAVKFTFLKQDDEG